MPQRLMGFDLKLSQTNKLSRSEIIRSKFLMELFDFVLISINLASEQNQCEILLIDFALNDSMRFRIVDQCEICRLIGVSSNDLAPFFIWR